MIAALAPLLTILLATAASGPASPVGPPSPRLAAASPTAGDEPDVVHLRNGTERRGRVVLRDYDRVVLVQGSRTREIPSEDVASIDAIEDRLARILDHHAVVERDDARALFELGRAADAQKLPTLGALLYRSALVVEPEHAEAHDRLSHRRRDGRVFTVPHEGKWFAWDDRIELAAKWNDAWELETPHYRVRTNLPLDRALDAAFDLERFYLFFVALFAAEIELQHPREKLVAHLHGDPASFPPIGYGRRAYYDVGADVLRVDASDGPLRHSLLHEATHQLLARGALGRNRTPAVPAWMDEGLAEYVALSASGAEGRVRFRAGVPSARHASTHASSEDPVGLTRMLALVSNDFLAKDAPLLYAQAYTLVHFCLHDEESRLREPFFEHLRAAFAGKASPTAFKHSISGVRDFEEVWREHARKMLFR